MQGLHWGGSHDLFLGSFAQEAVKRGQKVARKRGIVKVSCWKAAWLL